MAGCEGVWEGEFWEGMRYPIVLAEWEFHGERFQAWNHQERLWIVQEKQPVNDSIGPKWSVVAVLG